MLLSFAPKFGTTGLEVNVLTPPISCAVPTVHMVDKMVLMDDVSAARAVLISFNVSMVVGAPAIRFEMAADTSSTVASPFELYVGRTENSFWSPIV